MKSKVTVGITMGDPYGNGPELSVKAFACREIYDRCDPILIGDAASIRHAVQIHEQLGGMHLDIHTVDSVGKAYFRYGTIDVYDMGCLAPGDIPDRARGAVPFAIGATARGGEAAFRYVEKVIDLALKGEVDATVTNAISKEAINLAGHRYSGHAEIYAEHSNTSRYAMMLAHDELRVVHVSTHVSLREACDRVKRERVLECIRLADEACRTLGIQRPRVAVAGLNPHCGEGGLFGREEIEEIQPAIDLAMAEGIHIVEGKPVPPDTVFSKALGGWYDVVVVMYHDQGHIPVKVKGFVYDRDQQRWETITGINTTLGLPIIRVSVDHGTGYDRAGDGSANPQSLLNAIDYAVSFARYRAGSEGA